MKVQYISFVGAAIWLASCSAHQSVPPSQTRLAAASCTNVFELWQVQVSVGDDGADSVEQWVENVYRPHSNFWSGYLGDEAAFRRWASTVAWRADPRVAVARSGNFATAIPRLMRHAADLAGRPIPCSDWYLVLGPGWTNAGMLGDGTMVVDFLGLPENSASADLRTYLPHEVSHLLWRAGRARPEKPTLLDSIIDEGLATYFSQKYHGDSITAAHALGYSDAEFAWALEKETGLWRGVTDLLRVTDPDAIHPYRSASTRPAPEAPGKLGYFIGYRIVSAYVARHGPESWSDLYTMDAEEILPASGYDERHRS